MSALQNRFDGRKSLFDIKYQGSFKFFAEHYRKDNA